ncbi:MAG: FRG domain-containing protein [Deltaproteobacteria bacterium]|jgi:hypothetical protein
MLKWQAAHEAWQSFMERLTTVQRELHCSYRNAWFRGHPDANYKLTPSILRQAPPPGLGELSKMNSHRGPTSEELRRPKPMVIDGLEPVDGPPAEANSAKRHRVVDERKLDSTEKFLETDVRSDLRSTRAALANALNSIEASSAELREISQQLQQKRDRIFRDVLIARRRDLKNSMSDARGTIASERDRILVLRSICYGERDTLLAFRHRSSAVLAESSSWVTLAAMQHHGVPTRLLDWTTSAGVGLYFAVKSIRERMISNRGSIENWLESNWGEIDLREFDGLPLPCLWVLNPYFLARRTTGQNRIEDPTLRPDLDYLLAFHENLSWPYNGAVPVLIPWRSERIFAQRGVFTVHGRDTRPLECQVPVMGGADAPLLASVPLGLEAAVYAVRHIVQFIGLDQFTVFRGEDDLGTSIRDRHIARVESG